MRYADVPVGFEDYDVVLCTRKRIQSSLSGDEIYAVWNFHVDSLLQVSVKDTDPSVNLVVDPEFNCNRTIRVNFALDLPLTLVLSQKPLSIAGGCLAYEEVDVTSYLGYVDLFLKCYCFSNVSNCAVESECIRSIWDAGEQRNISLVKQIL